MKTTSAFIFSVCLAVAHGFVVPHGPVRSTPVGCRPAAAAPLLPAQQLLSSRVAPRSTAAPVMGLFGLGAPELAIIGGVALMILGPDQLKKLAKDVGKVSAELKQVPEEFNKGMEVGSLEAEKKKMTEAEAEPTDTAA